MLMNKLGKVHKVQKHVVYVSRKMEVVGKYQEIKDGISGTGGVGGSWAHLSTERVKI